MGWTGQNNDQWVEYSDQEWGVDPEPFYLLNQIWTDDTYVYAATTDGLNIIDLISEQKYAQMTYRDGLNSVWADSDKVYVATTNSGVKYIEKSTISGAELSQHLTDYLNTPEILSDKVRYIHGNGPHMLISTDGGINYRGPDEYYQRTSTATSIARKVFVTSTGKIYYTTWDGSVWRVNVRNNGDSSWYTPDKIYETGSFVIFPGIDILDIFVTEGTSSTNIDNTLFVATTSGVFVIDEELDDSVIYYTA